jgi:hypothetical protein
VSENNQSVVMGYMRDSAITQISNNYENKEIVNEYLQEKFEEINKLFEESNLDKIEEIIINIDEKKEKLESSDELQLLEYKALLNILRKKFDRVNFYIQRIDKIGNGEHHKDTIKFNLAIHKNDFEIFREELIIKKVSNCSIDEKELEFFFHTYKFLEGIKFFEKHRGNVVSEDVLAMVAKMYICYQKNESGKEILDNISLKSEDIKLWLTIIELEAILSQYIYIADFVENEDLEKIIKSFLEINIDKISAWEKLYLDMNLVRLYIFYDVNKAEHLVLSLRERSNDLKINILYMDVLEQLRKFEELENIYEEIMQSIDDDNIVSDLIYRGILIKYHFKKYNEVIKLYEDYIDFDDYIGDCTYFYGKSLIEMNGTVKTKNLLQKKIEGKNNFELLLLAELNLGNKEKANGYLEKILNKIDVNNDINLYISEIYMKMERDIKSAFNILKKGAEVKVSFFRELIRLAASTPVDSEFNKVVVKIFLLNYNDSIDEFINGYFYNLFAEKKETRSGYLIAKKMYNKNEFNEIWVNRFLESKIVRHEYKDIQNLINKIQETKNAHYLINVATGYCHLKMFELCIEWSFRAYYYMNEVNKEFILIRLGQIGLELEQNFNKLEFPLKLDGDFVMVLEDEVGIPQIYCFNKQCIYNSFRKESNIHFRSIDDDLYLLLFDKEVGESEFLNEVKLKVIDKIHKYSYMFTKGCEAFFGISQKITISENPNEDGIQPIIDMLELQEFNQNENLKAYLNNKIPFTMLCSSLELVPAYINSLRFSEDKYIYAGKSYIKSIESKKIILSLRSIFLLYFNNLLEVLVETYDVVIGVELINFLKEQLSNLYKELSKDTKRIGTINGKPFINEETKICKIEEIKSYKEIINILENVEVVKVGLEKNILISLPEKIFLDIDIESIEIGKREDGIILLEDNYFSEIVNQIYPNVECGTIGNLIVLLSLNNDEKTVKLLKVFIRQKYKYTFVFETLVKFIFRWNISSKKDEQNFESIISLLIIYDFDGYYKKQLKYILYSLKKNHLLYRISLRKINMLENAIKSKLIPSCFTENLADK